MVSGFTCTWRLREDVSCPVPVDHNHYTYWLSTSAIVNLLAEEAGVYWRRRYTSPVLHEYYTKPFVTYDFIRESSSKEYQSLLHYPWF